MKIKRVILRIDNGRRPDIHVELDTVLPADTKFGATIVADGADWEITGLRSPPSAFVTIRPKVST